MNDPLKRPLEFGDPEQIEALKKAERVAAFNSLPECLKCEGAGYCGHCDAECEKCEGTGKEAQLYRTFRIKNPEWSQWDIP